MSDDIVRVPTHTVDRFEEWRQVAPDEWEFRYAGDGDDDWRTDLLGLGYIIVHIRALAAEVERLKGENATARADWRFWCEACGNNSGTLHTDGDVVCDDCATIIASAINVDAPRGEGA